ncbi:MAG: NRDE family protein [Propionibacteriaceae bacterium]|jgi:uncharacterized protein with NRDE domain|nr:NRDE family protein [Micropruina sp.]HBX82683.1 hypothetical protein [Propionibacteriaceae bacterium]HBY24767.1 hypothetical protein [Propionibacteriaceae bacterium]
MCTVVLRFMPTTLWALLVRDELLDRPTTGYGPWWPDNGARVYGSQDLQAGGTAAALDFDGRLACVVNGPPEPPNPALLTRGFLPLDALRGRFRSPDELRRTAPFYLVNARFDGADVRGWVDGEASHTRLTSGDHVLVNAGLDVPFDERAAAVHEALKTTQIDSDPRSWEPVMKAAVMPPRQFEGRWYGTVGVTAVRLWQDGLEAHVAMPLPADPLPWVPIGPG